MMSAMRVVHLPSHVLQRIDIWRREQEPTLTRTAAIEELLRLGLMVSENSALAKIAIAPAARNVRLIRQAQRREQRAALVDQLIHWLLALRVAMPHESRHSCDVRKTIVNDNENVGEYPRGGLQQSPP